MQTLRKLLITLFTLFFAHTLLGQVTTSSMSGVVSDEQNAPLVGATVVIIHTPTGSKYTTSSQTGGYFSFPNIVPGGPYTITVSYVGLAEYKRTDINVPLGDKYDISVQLTSAAKELEAVVISGRKSNVIKTGAATSITRTQILNTPNISRSLTGLTKLTPQSNGNSFAGMNNRYNNITIDGSVFNNNFGRSGDGMVPGGGLSISLDAIDQIQVNLSPFDVRQAGFVGGGINAVTRRGTNDFYATAYTFQRFKSFYGTKVADGTADNSNLSSKVYGGSIKRKQYKTGTNMACQQG